MAMDTTTGTKAVLWGSVGTELIGVVFDLRYMVLLSVALILTDLWWGYSESRLRHQEAVKTGKAVLVDLYKWHKSRAIRRTANKFVDYLSYLIVGALLGMAITEPMGWCSHVITACVGLILGCLCELASIVGHFAYVKFGVELKMVDVWQWLARFAIALVKKKSHDVGEAVEEAFDKEPTSK